MYSQLVAVAPTDQIAPHGDDIELLCLTAVPFKDAAVEFDVGGGDGPPSTHITLNVIPFNFMNNQIERNIVLHPNHK